MGKIDDEIESRRRQMENLLGDLDLLIPLFKTKSITDIYVYSDGKVYVKDFNKGTYFADIELSLSDRLRIIYSLSSVADAPIDKWARPTLESIIPKYNIRTTAILPPWTESPEITFRRPAEKIFTLEEYVDEGRLAPQLYEKIISHIKNGSNIVVSGATGSGKTTFSNACIDKMYNFFPDFRYYIVEDTPELQCQSPFKTQLYIRKDQAVAALQTALRWTPKRIIFGELRSGEVAMELIEAWKSGHPGITTIHSNNAATTIPRIEGLLRLVITGQIPDFSEYIQLLVHLIDKPDFGPFVSEVYTVEEIKEAKNQN